MPRPVLALALAALALLSTAAPARAAIPPAATTCDVLVTEHDDVDDVRRALRPGQVVCIRGTVRGDLWIVQPHVTLMSEPGQRGTLAGELVIAREAPHAMVRDLDIDGRDAPYPSPTVYGDHATFLRNDVTNRKTDICFQIGPGGKHQVGLVRGTQILDNRIHDCGRSTNHLHGVYVVEAIDTRVIGNTIFDNGDRGVQIYHGAKRTLVAGNVIDGNGEGVLIGGGEGMTSTGSRVRHNVVTNMRVRGWLESYWEKGSPVGWDNLVEDNCVWGTDRPLTISTGGVTTRRNLLTPITYANRARKDFRLPAGSHCAKLLDRGRALAGLAPASRVTMRRRARARAARSA